MTRGRNDTIERVQQRINGPDWSVWTKWGYREIVDVVYRDGLFHLTYRSLGTHHTMELHRGDYVRVRTS